MTTTIKDATLDEIRSFFAGQQKIVLTFVGYSGAEYEDKPAMLATAGRVLAQYNPAETTVNIGATSAGIGAVYELAKRKGFTTTGIVSSQAKKSDGFSASVDYVFFVEDSTWGGLMEESHRLSPTSTAMVENSDVMIGIGGGEIGRDELLAAKRAGKEVQFFPADMNHQIARDKAQKEGAPEPDNFAGAAAEVFLEKTEFK